MDKFDAAVLLAREGKLGPTKELFLDLLTDEPNNTDLLFRGTRNRPPGSKAVTAMNAGGRNRRGGFQ